MNHLPLHGVRILDCTVVWAGPFASMLLGDLGAEVIRIESIQRPDTVTRGEPHPTPLQMSRAHGSYYVDREPGERPWNRTGYFNYAGRHKLSMTVDLRRPEGLEQAHRLAAVSDVLVDNNRWGTLEKLGLGYAALRQVRPDLIYLAMPGYGTTGPYASHRGFGANIEGVVGHTWLRGYPDADPSLTYIVFHSDAAGGATAAFAIMAALRHRRLTGQGQFIDLSQADAMLHHLTPAFMDYSMNRRAQATLGNRSPWIAPQGVYRCRGQDDWVAIAVRSDDDWTRLCGAIGQPGLAQDTRYASLPGRRRHHDEIDEVLRVYARLRDKYEVMETLQRAGVPCGAVVSHYEAHYDPHLTARGFFELLAEPEAGMHLHPGRGFRFSETPLHVRAPAPPLGGHNNYVYRHLLGCTDSEYQRLVESGHAGEAYAAAGTS